MKPHLFRSGSHRHTLNVQDNLETTLVFDEKTSGSLILFVEGKGSLKLTLEVMPNSFWTILWLNRSEAQLEVSEDYRVHRGSEVHANYAEFTTGQHKKVSQYHLIGEGAVLEMKAAVLAASELNWVVKADHQARRTVANLNSYGIVLAQGGLSMEVIGYIANGNSGSKTHQLTRVLNLGDRLKTVVYPKLLIEENDVEASHAASVGQPNEDQIYYMQSRGLTRLDALKLIVLGYLLPVAYEVTDETVRQALEEEIQEKVKQQWQ